MANEITLTADISVVNGFVSDSKATRGLRVDQSGTKVSSGVQTIGTSYESVNVSSGISTAGYAYFRNVDPDNFIEVGGEEGSTFVPVIKLDPGEVALLPLSTTSIFAQADTADAELLFWVLEA